MKKILITFLSILLVLGMITTGIGYYVYLQLKPVAGSVAPRITFAVPRGQSVSAIGQRLQDLGLIHQAWLFRIVVWHEGLGQKIQAGGFLISPSMSTVDIAHALTNGTNDVWIRLLEGWRVEEIADSVESQNFAGFDKNEFLTLTKKDEGYLFPDSYLVQQNLTAPSLYALLKDTFQKKITKGLAPEIASSPYNFQDAMIMASIVQREARDPDQMKMVAGILWNRVKIGMALDADATLQYVKGYDPIQKTWWTEPLLADKEMLSPFNTYKNPGLPPHPICNPGVDAIRAALNPTPSHFLFYVHDVQGNLHYAATLEEHNANVQKYLR